MPTPSYDFPALKAKNDIVTIIDKFVPLKKRGTEYVGKCPWHGDNKASLTVNQQKQVFMCPVCGDKGGDMVDFLNQWGYTHKQAAEFLGGGELHIEAPTPVQSTKKAVPANEWRQATSSAPCQNIYHPVHGSPAVVWPYHDIAGNVIGYDCRFETSEGKLVIPLTYCTNGTAQEWRWKGLDAPRALYNLHKIAANPKKTVIIFEGSKTADAGERLITTGVATSWQGGAKAIAQTDWKPLYGRTVVIWADLDYTHTYGEKSPHAGKILPWNEQPGNHAAIAIYNQLRDHCPIIRFVHSPLSKPCGWDLADAEQDGWNSELALTFLKENVFKYPSLLKPDNDCEWKDNPFKMYYPATAQQPEIILNQHSQTNSNEQFRQENYGPSPSEPAHIQFHNIEELPPVSETQLAITSDETYIQEQAGGDDCPFFRFVGYSNNDGKLTHCFYSNETRTIIKLSASSMGKGGALLDLAPLHFWEEMFPGKTNFDGQAAVNWLIASSRRSGMFRDGNIRGRGAWIEGDKTVVHSGDQVIVNGKAFELGEYRSRYVYEQGTALGFDPSNPLSSKEAKGFLDLCKLFNWERDVNAYLLAGWCVIAPMCGALTWRPHIWVTGGAGTGKSWIFRNMLKEMIGNIGLFVQGPTTEPGLRQALRRDALPVIFDEAEGDSRGDQERMQSVLNLARAASAEDGGNMVKGGQGGAGAVVYQIRSCFAWASIGMQMSQQSDRTRISVLSLQQWSEADKARGRDKAQFANLLRAHAEIMSPEYAARMQARTVSLLPTIIKNAKVFAAAGAAVLGGQRAGDQLGALLAGAYSLVSDKEITYEEAIEWVKDKDWSEETALAETRDEHNLFSFIVEQAISIEGAYGNKYERSIGETIRIAGSLEIDELIGVAMASKKLARCGIKVQGTDILISNNSEWVKRSLANTPWAKNYSTMLLRIEGATKVQPLKFGGGTSARSVSIPMKFFLQ